MMLSIDYKIEFIDGEHHVYVLVGDTCCPIYSSYYYKHAWETMTIAKHMQKLVTIEGTA